MMFLTATAPESASRLDLFLGTGLSTLLIGMLVVFAILGIIFIALTTMRAIFKRNAIKAKQARKAEIADVKTEIKAEATPAPAEETAPVAPAADDTAVIAAIIAAMYISP